MGIQNINALFPDGFLYQDFLVFTVGIPDDNGVFTISGPVDQVNVVSITEFQLNTLQVTDNQNGSYTATSP